MKTNPLKMEETEIQENSHVPMYRSGISGEPILDAEVDHFIAVFQGTLIHYRGYPRTPFNAGGKPRKHMAAAALQCRQLGISAERYLGILFGRYCKLLGRREPSPRTLASSEAWNIVKARLAEPGFPGEGQSLECD